jgi:hypothetical protein
MQYFMTHLRPYDWLQLNSACVAISVLAVSDPIIGTGGLRLPSPGAVYR